MSTFISNEEKRQILISLRSAVPATRFLMLKKLAEITEREPEKLRALSSQDEYTFSDILNAITYMKKHDRDEVIRREASITLEKIKAVLEPKHVIPVTHCATCGSLIDIGWNYCPTCGKQTRSSTFPIPRCPKCDRYIKETWLYCVHCRHKLKEKKITERCPNCKREVEESWILCPYCGYKLKNV